VFNDKNHCILLVLLFYIETVLIDYVNSIINIIMYVTLILHNFFSTLSKIYIIYMVSQYNILTLFKLLSPIYFMNIVYEIFSKDYHQYISKALCSNHFKNIIGKIFHNYCMWHIFKIISLIYFVNIFVRYIYNILSLDKWWSNNIVIIS